MTTLDPDNDRHYDPAEKIVGNGQVVELAMRGMSYRAIADELNVPAETIRRMLNAPEGQRLLREARDEYLGRTGRMMSSLGMVALQTLGQVLVSETSAPRDRIAAASKILDLQHRHAITIEGIQPGQSVTISQDSDDLEWLHARARQIRSIIETSSSEVEQGPVVVAEPEAASKAG